VTLLWVQQFSQPSASVRSSGDVAMILGLVVLATLSAAAWLFVNDWRQFRDGEGAALVHEAERWLRRQRPGPRID
jgi:hypothetical protein